MRFIFIMIAAFVLAACDMNALASKVAPDDVEAMAQRDIDAIFARDINHFKAVQGERSDEEFETVLGDLFDKRRGGEEVSRHIVGANSSKNISMGSGENSGTNARYETVYEIQTEDGYTIVELLYVQTPQMKACCELNYINVHSSDTSPQMEAIRTTKRVSKYVGLGALALLVLILGLIFFLVRRSRRTKALAQDV